MHRRRAEPHVRAVAAAVGGIVGAGLMGGIGYTHGTSMVTGVVAGAVLLGALCYGVAAGTMSAVTLCAVLSGLFFCMIGPGATIMHVSRWSPRPCSGLALAGYSSSAGEGTHNRADMDMSQPLKARLYFGSETVEFAVVLKTLNDHPAYPLLQCLGRHHCRGCLAANNVLA
jgi:hypothetical protein